VARVRHRLVLTATAGVIASGCSGLLGLDPLPGGDESDVTTSDSGPEAATSTGQDGRAPSAEAGPAVDANNDNEAATLPPTDGGSDANANQDADSGAVTVSDSGTDASDKSDTGAPPPYGQPAGFPNTPCLSQFTTVYTYEDQDTHSATFSSGAVTPTISATGTAAHDGSYGVKIVAPAGQVRAVTGIDFSSLTSGSGSNYMMCEADLNVFTAASFAAYSIVFASDYLSFVAQGTSVESGSPSGLSSAGGTFTEGEWMHLRYWVMPFNGNGKVPVTWSLESYSDGAHLGLASRNQSDYPINFIVGIDKTSVDGPGEVHVDNLKCCAKAPL
jgi:hypothetical protein